MVRVVLLEGTLEKILEGGSDPRRYQVGETVPADRTASQTPYSALDCPTMKNYLAPEANYAEAEEPWSGGTSDVCFHRRL